LTLYFQIDLEKPLEDQGPFDMILHKFTDLIVKAQHGYIQEQRIMQNIEVRIDIFWPAVLVKPICKT